MNVYLMQVIAAVAVPLEMLVVALFLAMVANRLVEAFVAPIRKKFPKVDFWWLIYVTWFVGGLLGWVANINLFEAYLPEAPEIGRILTAIVIGGGSNLIHDFFDKPNIEIAESYYELGETLEPEGE